MNQTFYAGRAAVLAALLLAMVSSCSSSGSNGNGAAGASTGGAQPSNTGGGAASGDVGGGSSALSAGASSLGAAGNGNNAAGANNAGGSSATGGAPVAGAAGSGDGGSGGQATASGGSASGGAAGAASTSVLFIGGDSPMVGVDLQLHQVLQGMKLQVEDARETAVPAQASGKRLVVLSYSMASTSFKAEDWASLPVPIIVLEHYLLPRLGMTKTDDHGYHDAATQIQITSDDPIFAAGMPKGTVTVYSQVGEFFWGIPAPSALTIATVVGTPNQTVTFGYTAGSMMAGMVAPARRVQVFVAVHAPPANPTQFLSADGLKLFGGAAAWAIN